MLTPFPCSCLKPGRYGPEQLYKFNFTSRHLQCEGDSDKSTQTSLHQFITSYVLDIDCYVSLRCPDFSTSSLLALVAYNVTSGPFKTLWVKLGYDPRQDPSSKRYQCFDFRVPRDVDAVMSVEYQRFHRKQQTALQASPGAGASCMEGIETRAYCEGGIVNSG